MVTVAIPAYQNYYNVNIWREEKFDRLIQLAKDSGTLDAVIRKWINET